MRIQLIEQLINDQLNPKLYDANDSLREDVSKALLRISESFIKDLREYKVPINVIDIWLVGSNASYNYTDKSDIDVHIIANFDEVSNEKDLLTILYNYVKSDFNKNYDIKVKGMEVEVYIEDMNTTSITNGVYSILHNEWIKFPLKLNYPSNLQDIDIRNTDLYKVFYNQYLNLEDKDIEDYVNRLYILRKASLMKDGEFGLGNLVFKELRNLGILDELKERKRELRSKELTLEGLKEGYLNKATPYMLRNDGKLIECSPLHPYINYHPEYTIKEAIEDCIRRIDFIEWFYKNTSLSTTKRDIELFLKSLLSSNYFNIDKEIVLNSNIPLNKIEPLNNIKDIEYLFNCLNDSTNQEFLRVRTSSMKFGGSSGRIYFRISSTDFDWFPLIWKLVYDNRNFIESVTICTDTQSRGGAVKFYEYNGVIFRDLPIQEFINISGNPIIENKESEIFKLQRGQGLVEAFQDIHPGHIHNCFESLVSDYIRKNFK